MPPSLRLQSLRIRRIALLWTAHLNFSVRLIAVSLSLGSLVTLVAYGPAGTIHLVSSALRPQTSDSGPRRAMGNSSDGGRLKPDSLQANGKLAFSSDRDGNVEIYVMNADGTGQTNVTNNPADDGDAVFSPDGKKIAFTSTRNGNDEIYLMNADGSNQTRLTNNAASDFSPSFSPDGSKIVFGSNRDGNEELYLMNADGTGQTRITNNPAVDQDAAFSPDGSKIVFASDRLPGKNIFVMNPDGTSPTSVTNDPSANSDPSFSPDGSKIIFRSNRAGNEEIFIMNANGTGLTNLTNNAADDGDQSCFSPDGSKIVFNSDRDGNIEVYVMNPDGSNQTRITNSPTQDGAATWQTLLSCTPPPTNGVSWYRAEGNANDNLGTNNGTLQNGATFAPGFIGQAFSLDGADDHVTIADAPDLRPTAFTIDGWFMFASAPTTDYLVAKGLSPGGADSFSLSYASGSLLAQISDDGSSTAGVFFDFTPALKTWYHFAMTKDAGNFISLYINGVLVVTSHLSVNVSFDNHPVLLGAHAPLGTPNAFHHGLIDEVEIFSRALTLAEIKNIYDAKSAGKCLASAAQSITVSNTNDGGPGSLRQAILDANASPGIQTIDFNIPGSGVHTIAPVSGLPPITDAVIIDGYTQPGASANTLAAGDDAVLLIELNGTNAGAGASGLIVQGANSLIRGLVINRFSNDGITLSGAGANNNVVAGNFLGTNPTGTVDLGNQRFGVVADFAPNNLIGGNVPAARNLISGNNTDGVRIVNSTATGNQVKGNFIGTDVNGTADLGNSAQGVVIDAAGNTVGGTTAAERNVISGNDNDGVRIVNATAPNNVVSGNYIGTDVNGVADLGNTGKGVDIINASTNTVGGVVAGARNVISGNNQHGVEISGATATSNTVRGNFIGINAAASTGIANSLSGVALTGAANNIIAGNTIAFNTQRGIVATGATATGNALDINFIFSNGQLGIDLGGDGVTANDAGDVDSGANSLQNFPVISSATSAGASTILQGTLNSAANTQFNIEFFVSPGCNASGNGEGQNFLDLIPVTTDSNGNASFTPTIGSPTSAGQVVTAIAIDPSGNTSEFSQCRQVTTSSFSVAGRVLDDSGNPLGNVAVALSGNAAGNTSTDVSGNYSFANVPAAGNYTVTPSGATYAFNPASQSFNNLDTNRIANFVGTLTKVNIAGNVVDSGNLPLNNVTMALTVNGSPAGTTATNVLGNYSFGNLAAGANYVVTPTGTFTPSSQTLVNLTANAAANFKAAPSIPPQCNTASFAAVSNFAVGDQPNSVVVADFNGDGKSDLATANLGTNNVSILLGLGNGSFSAATDFAVGANPDPIAIGDFNGDGKTDLAVANRTSNNVSILLGLGTGSFSAATNFAVGSTPRSVASGDFNGDGKTDLATANFNSGNVSILLGLGNGSFSAATNFAVGANPVSVAIGDLNGDGKTDLATANSGSSNVSILLGSGTGNFSAATNFAVGTGPISVTSGDFNGDGNGDLATANSGSTNVSVLLGSGTGSFGAATNFAVGTNPLAVAIGDFNGDGKLDLAVANEVSNNVSILLGLGTGSFSTASNFSVGSGPTSVAIVDLNGDSKNDLAAANAGTDNVSILLNNGAICNTQTSLTLSGQITSTNNNPLADVTVTLSGPITRVTSTDINGNYTFVNLVPGGNYSVTVQSNYFVFAPSRGDFFNLSSSQTANFLAAPVAVPAPSPPPSDDFNSAGRDASKWSIGTQTASTVAFDPQVTAVEVDGQLVITPVAQATGLHFGGYTSANAFDLRNGKVGVELVKAATGGADTIFAIGSDSDNFYRFMVHSVGTPSSLAPTTHRLNGIEGPLDASVPLLIFQVRINGQLTSLSINYDPVQHRFMRFRHIPLANSIVFETSPNDIDYTVQTTVVLQKSVSALTAELTAGTSNPANPGATVFDNFGLVTSTFQFSSSSYAVNESDNLVTVTVTRSGSTATPASVDFATADGTALQRTRYINTAGRLSFAAGELSKTFDVLVEDNAFAEGNQTVNLLLMNPVGSGLNSPGRSLLNIADNDSSLATGNPLEDPRFFVTQNYYDFLSRFPDQGGSDFWTGLITSCAPNDPVCVSQRRITVSNAFFFELEFQQTGAYVFRLYRTAFGNNQPFPNPDANQQFPGQNLKLPSYEVFARDRAQVVGGASLAQSQLGLANAFVQRSEFIAKYPASLDGPGFVDAMLANILSDLGVNLSSQRDALITLFNQGGGQGGRGAVLYRLADDNQQSNPINNRSLIDAEYIRSFVATQYFGYLRRDADIGGFLFWLGQVNSAPLRDLSKQRAMVCAFITSGEYQQRFSLIVTRNDHECQ